MAAQGLLPRESASRACHRGVHFLRSHLMQRGALIAAIIGAVLAAILSAYQLPL